MTQHNNALREYPELLPCPFGCPDKPLLHRVPGLGKLWRVSCVNCDASRNGRFSEAEAITAWNQRADGNNRPTPSPAPDALAEMADAAAWDAWPHADDYPERDAYRDGFRAALSSPAPERVEEVRDQLGPKFKHLAPNVAAALPVSELADEPFVYGERPSREQIVTEAIDGLKSDLSILRSPARTEPDTTESDNG